MAHEVMEHIQLVGYFVANGRGILQSHHRIQRDPVSRMKDFFTQIDMQPKTEAWMFPGNMPTPQRHPASAPSDSRW